MKILKEINKFLIASGGVTGTTLVDHFEDDTIV